MLLKSLRVDNGSGFKLVDSTIDFEDVFDRIDGGDEAFQLLPITAVSRAAKVEV